MLTIPSPIAPVSEQNGVARPDWRPIHYLGSKLRIAEPIRNLLREVDPRLRPVCDLFAGSGTVASALASSRDVVAADIQEYSRVICSAVLKPAHLTRDDIQKLITEATNSTFYRDLKWALDPLISQEQIRIASAVHGKLDGICALLENSPLALAIGGDQSLKIAIAETRRRLKSSQNDIGGNAVTVRQFGGVYFSYLQAVQLSTLLTCVKTLMPQWQDAALAAVMSTASEVVNTVGKQFAQPLQIRDGAGKAKPHLITKIARDRQLDVFAIFSLWLERYGSLPKSDRAHKAICSDYLATLDRHCQNVGVVYADPPYTRDHYSRYYHVLETMCLNDDPKISYGKIDGAIRPLRGIYRTDRHQSPFCIKTQAPAAFEKMFSKVRDLGVPLVLSYSPLPNSSKPRPRVMTIDDISAIARRFFKKVDRLAIKGIIHNKLNTVKLNSEVSANAEIFLVCF
jgi:adenine-specific DNA-methyltransferase